MRAICGAGVLAVIALCNGPAVAANADKVIEAGTTKGNGTIAAIASGDADLSTLVSALSDAGLVATLEGPGPFTVFAPTNQAFAAIPPGILKYLLANPKILEQVLLYHVVSGVQIIDFDLLPTPLKTVQGETLFAQLHYDFGDGKLSIKVNNSNVTLKPIIASNGVIYVIDSVLQPQYLQVK
jgi:uncharacterized surface protein with fasciclin (FAS1) repeats